MNVSVGSEMKRYDCTVAIPSHGFGVIQNNFNSTRIAIYENKAITKDIYIGWMPVDISSNPFLSNLVHV